MEIKRQLNQYHEFKIGFFIGGGGGGGGGRRVMSELRRKLLY
jgi:hypothetical protein